MDLEITQKVNTLANELAKKGLAPSSGDAFKMAENILKDEISTKQEGEKTNSIEKYEILLERANRKIGHELESFKGQINSLKEQIGIVSNELAFIREDLKKLKLAKIEAKTEKQEVLVEEKKELPKSGDYNPEDIAIEKIFYSGKKE